MKLIRLICLLFATIGVATAQTAAFDLPTFRVVPDYNTGDPGEIRFLESDGYATGAATDYIALRFSDELGVYALEMISNSGDGHFIPNSAGTQSLGLQLRPWAGIYGKELNLEHPDGGTKYLKFFYGSAGDATVTAYNLHFPPTPTPDNAGYVLVFDENGVATWQVNGGGGGGSCPTGADNEIQYYLTGNCGASSKLKFFPDDGSGNSSFNASNSAGASNFVFDAADASNAAIWLRRTSDLHGWQIAKPGSSLDLRILATTTSNQFLFTQAGLFGIGVSPTQALDVSGVSNFRGNIQPHITNTYTSGTTSLRWTAVNTVTLNLTGSVVFDGTLDPTISNQSSGADHILQIDSRWRPASNVAYNLGESTRRWDDVFAQKIDLGTSSTAQSILQGTAADNLADQLVLNNSSGSARVKAGVSAGGATGSIAAIPGSGNTISIVASGNSTTEGYWVGSNRIVGSRRTGWGAPTGTATRSTFATSTVTLPQLAERLKALIDDLTSHGLIGP